MSRFFVPYETRRRSTPDERDGVMRVPGRAELYVDSNCELPGDLIARLHLRLMSHNVNHFCYGGPPVESSEQLITLASLSEADGVELNIRIRQDVAILYGPPSGTYQYTYPDLLIQCDSCQALFPISALESYSDDEHCSSEICPRCGMHDCVELVYEKE